MEFNKSKSYVLYISCKKQSIGTLYYLQDTPLEISTKQKYLGVDLSNDLDWSHHINSIGHMHDDVILLLRSESFRILLSCAN